MRASRFINNNPSQGTTFLEVIFYIAIFSIAIGSVLLALYAVLDSRDAYLARTDVEEETNFLTKKIKWVLSNASGINQPIAGATSTILSVSKWDFANNPVAIGLNNNDMRISYAGAATTTLNSGNVSISNLVFEQLSGYNNPAIKIKFTAVYRWNNPKFITPSTTVETTLFLRTQ